jgi:hypothetical protein
MDEVRNGVGLPARLLIVFGALAVAVVVVGVLVAAATGQSTAIGGVRGSLLVAGGGLLAAGAAVHLLRR